jgi:hypothetical protein
MEKTKLYLENPPTIDTLDFGINNDRDNDSNRDKLRISSSSPSQQTPSPFNNRIDLESESMCLILF